MYPKHIFFALFFLGFAVFGCKRVTYHEPLISLADYKVADGFELKLVASEPLLNAPVAMDFDNQGRMWVVEMTGYMPNLEGTGEDAPNGKIVILEDLDKDGVADHEKVFLDSLVMPRAIALVYGGVLYAEPPNLWFVGLNGDRPGKRTLVDSIFSVGGNPEEQPNGLLMDIDNWIYNAKSNFRYQLKDGHWKKEPTSFRGQWGITKDNFGRLYYNFNTVQLTGDYVLPNTVIRNPYLKPRASIDQMLTKNQHVYPLHATTVNRGYEKGILNKDSMLVAFTAACGPLIYRGGQFPDDYKQNAFVCEPAANLVKRNILDFEDIKTTAKQAWDDREFLASTDEGFRPVNLRDGPDGAMYVLDMHRGIIQHKAYMTPYYHNQTLAKKLDTLVRSGRILRIKYKANKLEKTPDFDHASEAGLVNLLESPNGWVRDRAQQLLVFNQDNSIVPQLKKLLANKKNPVAAMHALHTLDGLNALSFDLLRETAMSESPQLAAHALLLLEKFNTKENSGAMLKLANDLLEKNNDVTDLYLAFALGSWIDTSPDAVLPLLVKISRKHAANAIYQEAVVSSLTGKEQDFQSLISSSNGQVDSNTIVEKLLEQVTKNKEAKSMNAIYVTTTVPVDNRTRGLQIFQSTCATCHGQDGNGIEYRAPPLNGSQYVNGPTDRLALIILKGLEGPIHVDGQSYEFTGAMPSFEHNLTDEEIADVIRYVHNAFVHNPQGLKRANIKELRALNTGTLTEQKLSEMYK